MRVKKFLMTHLGNNCMRWILPMFRVNDKKFKIVPEKKCLENSEVFRKKCNFFKCFRKKT
jgi:hypothetical protein